MDYEKKYKEALEVAQRFYNNSAAITKKGLEDIFPELAENEDERIRKGLIEYFLHYPDHEITYYGLKADFVIAWLEKQGKNNMGISEATKKKLEDNLNKALEKETPESFNKFLDEQKPVEWHREDEQNLNACLGYIPDEFLRRWLTDIIHIKYDKPAWSEEDEEMINKLLAVVDLYYGYSGNVLDKQSCTSFLKSLKDKYLLQPKQEWSEEDRLHYMNVLEALEYVKGCKSDYDKIEAIKSDIAWFKFLKDRYTWKPSEGQLECLGYAIEKAEKDWSPLTNNRIYLTLKALKEQLLELRGSKV